jgi:hypothetical protein
MRALPASVALRDLVHVGGEGSEDFGLSASRILKTSRVRPSSAATSWNSAGEIWRYGEPLRDRAGSAGSRRIFAVHLRHLANQPIARNGLCEVGHEEHRIAGADIFKVDARAAVFEPNELLPDAAWASLRRGRPVSIDAEGIRVAQGMVLSMADGNFIRIGAELGLGMVASLVTWTLSVGNRRSRVEQLIRRTLDLAE